MGRPELQGHPVARLQVLDWPLHDEVGTSPLPGPARFIPLAAMDHCRWPASHNAGPAACPSALLSDGLGLPDLIECPHRPLGAPSFLSLPEHLVKMQILTH